MKVTVGGQLQGICDHKTAKETAEKYADTVIVATCLVCGHRQKIEKVNEKCNACGSIGIWK